jgi:secondary thiamine-phosphate synthase enzyme
VKLFARAMRTSWQNQSPILHERILVNISLLAPATCFSASVIRVRTERARQFIDITDDILHRIQAADITNGLVVVASLHTTASIVVNENEPELLRDLEHFLESLAPRNNAYLHNGVPCGKGENPNGHAHCQALFLSTSVTFPIVAGEAHFGRYQRVFLVELDCARDRQVSVTLLGT